MKITTMYERVKHLLIKKTDYRDDDNLLVCRIWWDELLELKFVPEQMTAMEFLVLYRDQKLTSSDTITRARRKVQEENEHLRGKSYIERQNKQEEIKEEIRNIGNPQLLQQALSFSDFKQSISR